MSQDTILLLSVIGCVTIISCVKVICRTIENNKKCNHVYDNSEPILVEDCSVLGGSIKEKSYRVIQTCKKCGHIKTARIHKWGDDK